MHQRYTETETNRKVEKDQGKVVGMLLWRNEVLTLRLLVSYALILGA